MEEGQQQRRQGRISVRASWRGHEVYKFVDRGMSVRSELVHTIVLIIRVPGDFVAFCGRRTPSATCPALKRIYSPNPSVMVIKDDSPQGHRMSVAALAVPQSLLLVWAGAFPLHSPQCGPGLSLLWHLLDKAFTWSTIRHASWRFSEY